MARALTTGKRRTDGFTLIELMIVVAIIGILAAVAIPVFASFLKDARSSEFDINLKAGAEGAVSYYETDVANSQFSVSSKALPATVDRTPAAPVSCNKHSADTDWSAFEQLRFTLSKPFQGHYAWTNTSSGNDHSGYMDVWYDIDCDTNVGERAITVQKIASGSMRIGAFFSPAED